MAIQVDGYFKTGIGYVINPYLFLQVHTTGKGSVAVDVQIYKNAEMKELGGNIPIEGIEVDLEAPDFFINVHDAVVLELAAMCDQCTYEMVNIKEIDQI